MKVSLLDYELKYIKTGELIASQDQIYKADKYCGLGFLNTKTSKGLTRTIIIKDSIIVGYFTWDINTQPCLRQIDIHPNYRRKGTATAAIEYFYRLHGDFIIDAPNAIVLKILTKLNERLDSSISFFPGVRSWLKC